MIYEWIPARRWFLFKYASKCFFYSILLFRYYIVVSYLCKESTLFTFISFYLKGFYFQITKRFTFGIRIIYFLIPYRHSEYPRGIQILIFLDGKKKNVKILFYFLIFSIYWLIECFDLFFLHFQVVLLYLEYLWRYKKCKDDFKQITIIQILEIIVTICIFLESKKNVI